MAVPTLIQHATGAQNTKTADGSQVFWLPNVSLAGNCLLVAVQSDTSVAGVPTIADDKTNTWVTLGDIIGGQRLTLLGAFNVAAGTSKCTVTFNGTPNFTQTDFVGEFNNVSLTGVLDHTVVTNASVATPVKSGSQTTVTNGDLIVQVICDVTTGPPTSITKFAPDTNFSLSGAHIVDGMASQWGVQTTAGAINPGITVTGGADSFATITVAIKSAAAGTALPAGMRIMGMIHYPAYASIITTTMAFQFPCSGNLLVTEMLTFSLAQASTLSSIVDSKLNTWQVRSGPISGLTGVQNEIWSGENATTSNDLTGTMTWTSTLAGTVGGDTHFVLIDVGGAATSPFDVAANNTGNQVAAGNLSTVVITPTTSNGIIFCEGDIFSHTASGTSGVATPHLFVSPLMDGGGNDLDEDALWAHYYNPSTAAVTFTFTIQHNTAGVGTWGAVAAAFKAPASGTNVYPAVWNGRAQSLVLS